MRAKDWTGAASVPRWYCVAVGLFLGIRAITTLAAGASFAVPGDGWRSLFQLVARNRRRYGGYIVHASIVLLAIGIVGSGAYGTEREVPLAAGQSMQMPGYTLTNEGLTQTRSLTESGTTVYTHVHLLVHGRWNGTMTSTYVNSSSLGPSHDVGIHTNWLRGEDLYVILDQVVGNQVYLKVLVKPLVNLLWIAGYLFVFGSLVAMWPDAREQRRLVTRLSLARA